MAGAGNRHQRACAPGGGEENGRPIGGRAEQEQAERGLFKGRAKVDPVPDRADGDQERAVHQAFQMRRQPHPRIGEQRPDKACDEAQQEQARPEDEQPVFL